MIWKKKKKKKGEGGYLDFFFMSLLRLPLTKFVFSPSSYPKGSTLSFSPGNDLARKSSTDAFNRWNRSISCAGGSNDYSMYKKMR